MIGDTDDLAARNEMPYACRKVDLEEIAGEGSRPRRRDFAGEL